MKTFEEFQNLATKTPLSLRNNLDRINLPLMGLQEETGKVGSLLARATGTGTLSFTLGQRAERQSRLADILLSIALLCGETGIAMQDVATHGIAQRKARARELDPDQR